MATLTRQQKTPTNIEVDIKQGEVRILWGDDFQSTYSLDYLRQICPCAACNEMRRNQDPLRVLSADQLVVSAELRPEQQDEDSLPPYDILDAVLERYVERHWSTDEIIIDGYDESIVRWVARAVDLNEWKRQQAAPGIRVTTKAFGMGRRFPIAQRYADR